MPNKDVLFLITGGGTGAKVAESLVHLCAAGMGPREVHLLLIDADASNGNVRRTVSTVNSYEALADHFKLNPTTEQRRRGFLRTAHYKKLETNYFNSRIYLYQLLDPLDTTRKGGISNLADHDTSRQVLNLFYDESEQKDTCEDGFRARPNLGCLLMAHHLDNKARARSPFNDLIRALMASVQATGDTVSVSVAASVFGGTGASVLPVIKGTIEAALKRNGAQDSDINRLEWNAIKMLPHYQPQDAKESVDPNRFLLDSASALQFYSMAKPVYKRSYVIGSDRPARNLVKVHLGSAAQVNPPYFEEFVAALAVLDTLHSRSGTSVNVLVPNESRASITWDDLPFNTTLRQALATLLHLASYYLHREGSMSSQLNYGLRQLLFDISSSELTSYGWYRNAIDPWARTISPSYTAQRAADRGNFLRRMDGQQSMTALDDKVVTYFSRLLLWAMHTLSSGEASSEAGEGLDLLHSDTGLKYRPVVLEMNDVSAEEAGRASSSVVDPHKDNGLARSLRTALIALHRQTERDQTDMLPLVSTRNPNSPIAITATLGSVKQVLEGSSKGNVFNEYTQNRV